MPIRLYNSSGTFAWPDDVTHAEFIAIGGGGGGAGAVVTVGGGGGGGAASWSLIYRESESSLTITVGSGGAGGAAGGGGGGIAGGDSKVTRSSTDLIVAKGGGGGSRPTGGAGGQASVGTGTIKVDGGNAGDGASQRGGGGGASSSAGAGGTAEGGDGADGSDTGDPPGTATPGRGGVREGTLKGKGGDGGGTAFPIVGDPPDGLPGTAPGGGGGGGGINGFTSDQGDGGAGADGIVLVMWGMVLGQTKFSSRCCCAVCDLTSGDFPDEVMLTGFLNAATPPGVDFEDEYTIEADTFQWTTFDSCEDVTGTEHSWPESTTGPLPKNVLNQSLLGWMNGLLADGFTLPLDDFTAGFSGGRVFCQGVYRCPVTDTGDPWLGEGNYCPAGAPPDPGFDYPADTQDTCCPNGESGASSSAQAWVRRGAAAFAAITVTLRIERQLSDGKWYFAKTINTGGVSWAKNSGTHITNSPCVEIEDSGEPGLDGTSGETYAIPTGTATGGPYDTAKEVMEAARDAPITGAAWGTYHSEGESMFGGVGGWTAFVASVDGCCPNENPGLSTSYLESSTPTLYHKPLYLSYADDADMEVTWDGVGAVA